jgi:tRNA A-37 threonylcarbamoyl transferase component Bud32
VRFVFSPPAETAAGLLNLPWNEPLEEWKDDRLTEIPQRGISRHVVRFIAEDGEVFALKEIPERLARREYSILRRIGQMGIPAVEVLGVVVDRPDDLDAILVTRFLDFSSSFRALFANPRGVHMTDRLMDAQVELLVRLHLAGIFWGDCSLSNTLFRFDAGALAAYLVDAETAEIHAQLSEGQRAYDLDIAFEKVAAELMDLQAGDLLAEDLDPIAAAADLVERYRRLWAELTDEEVMQRQEQRYRIGERIRRLNELGFDVDEVELIEDPGGGSRLKLKTRVAEPGHHRRMLFARTGLDVQENQARRLLADIASFRGWLEQSEQRRVPEAVAASRWLTEIFEPIVRAVPAHLRTRLDQAEIFHEILEHRWFLSEAAGLDVGTTAAARDYFARVLPEVPEDLVTPVSAMTERDGVDDPEATAPDFELD